MTVTIIVLILIAIVLVGWMALPFLRQQPSTPVYAQQKGASPADVRRQLRDLEFDRATGKVDEEDYADIKAIKQQELSVPGHTNPTTRPAAPQIAQPSQTHTQYLQSRRAEALAEAEIAIARARLRLKKASWQCAQCGHKMSGDSQFCASCGTPRVAPDVTLTDATLPDTASRAAQT